MKKGNLCPLLKKTCIENKCAWYCQIRGTNPNTGEPVDEWQCVVNMIPILLIENSQQQRSTGAAVESFRNETVKQNDTLSQVLTHSLYQQQNLLAAIQPPTVKLLTEDDAST